MNKIYILKDPNTEEIRYVGKTKNDLNKRLYEHCTERNLKCNNHKNNWIRKLKRENKRPTIELIEIVENWEEREKFWIKFYREIGYNLTNDTDGGEGAIGSKRSKETTDKIINSKIKNDTLKRSIECRKKISESLKGRKISESHKEKFLQNSFDKKEVIIQYDLNMNFIKEWNGVRECSRELNISHCGIIRCLKNKQKAYKNFIWKYKITK